ncbi:MAG: JDVT-CTERM domain-containing protein [Leptothrix ochracea]|uniref:JDVT-CTERM domain-containing protein n=1 Tax=Leptothrix ochracea TaxID=735331 RepID=UPI0034E26282
MSPYKGIADSNYNDLAAFIAQQVGGGVVATCTSAGVPTASSLATAVVCPPSSGTGTGSGASGAAASSSSGGGCTLGRTDASTDPLWMVLLGSAAMVLRRRRQGRKQLG